MMVQKGMTNGWLMLVVAIVAGTLVGWINGMLLTRLSPAAPIRFYLGMKNVLWGSALLITGSQEMILQFPRKSLGWAAQHSRASRLALFWLFCFTSVCTYSDKDCTGTLHLLCGRQSASSSLSGIHSANVLTFCYTFLWSDGSAGWYRNRWSFRYL